MKVLSLFDGMACGALALLSAGVEIESYDAFEIDKYAVKTSSHNFPFIKHHGDVFEADFTQFEGVDLVCGGSPCTYWSIAQKNNRETVASGMGWELFSQYVRAVKEAKPKFFIYENNKSMSKAIRQSIDETFGFEAVLINSALVSAQNRQRLYWVGRRNEDGTYSKVNVEQPEDRGIVLRDILETGVAWRDKSYCLDANYYKASNGTTPCGKSQSSQRMCVAEPVGDTKGKAFCLTANYPGAHPEHTLRKSVRTMVAEPVNTTDDGEKSHTLKAQYYKNGIANFVTNGGFGATAVAEPVRIPPYGNEDKARPINALYPNNCGGFEHRMFSDNPNKQQVDMVAEPIRIGDIGSNSQAHRVYSCDGKSVTLSANGGGQGGKTGLYATPICHTIPQVVRVRKYTCDIEKFQELLRESKRKSGLTNKDIAKKFNRPQTEVEHWFRTDKYFNVPDAEIWDKLKDFLNIETTEYDAFVTVFEEREGVFEKADRCYDVNGKMSTLMTTQSDNIIEPATYKGKPIYEVKDGFITIKDKKYPIKLKDGYYIIRKLTVRECMRLQTVPEWYEFPVSDSQAYKMLGNGWTVEVIAHLIKACLTDKGEVQLKMLEQVKFF